MWNQISTPKLGALISNIRTTNVNGRNPRNFKFWVKFWAILNSEWCFKNRILMVLDLYIPRFGVIHWITFNIEIVKICPWKKLWRFWLPGFNQNIVRVSLIKLAVHGHSFQFFWTTIFCSSAILGHWAKIRRSGSTTEGTTVVPFWNCSTIIHRNDM